MQGAPKRQVNAEEMLAELKRALEASARAPNIPPALGSRAAKSSSRGQESRRVQRSMRPGWRSWKLTAGGLALAGAAAICAGFVFMNQAAPPKRELAPAEALVKAQHELARERSGAARASIEGSRAAESTQAEILQAGKLARPSAGAAPANSAPFPVREAADADAPNLAAFGLESPPPIFAPPLVSQAPALGRSERIGPDGAPIPAAHTPASTGSAPQAEAPKPNATPAAAAPAVRPEAAKVEAPSAPASTDSTREAETPKPKAAPAAASPMARPEAAKVAAAPPVPASTGAAPRTEAPKPKAAPAASPTVRPEAAKVAAAPSAAASTGSAP